MILALIVFLTGIILVIGYGGNNPSVVGHSFEEIEGVQKKISGVCNSSSAIREIHEDGSVGCSNIEKGKLDCWDEYGGGGSIVGICNNKCNSKGGICVGAEGESNDVISCGSQYSYSSRCRCCKVI